MFSINRIIEPYFYIRYCGLGSLSASSWNLVLDFHVALADFVDALWKSWWAEQVIWGGFFMIYIVPFKILFGEGLDLSSVYI